MGSERTHLEAVAPFCFSLEHLGDVVPDSVSCGMTFGELRATGWLVSSVEGEGRGEGRGTHVVARSTAVLRLEEVLGVVQVGVGAVANAVEDL